MSVIKKFLIGIIDGFKREPVLGFGLIGLYVAAYQPHLIDTDAKKAFIAGLVLFLQRAFSTPTSKVEEKVEVAKYVGALENQTVTQAAALVPPAPQPPPEPVPLT